MDEVAKLLALAKKYAKAEARLHYAKTRGYHPGSIDANRAPRDKARANLESGLRKALEGRR